MQTSNISQWEEKGIIIGLFIYIIKHHNTLLEHTIIINNDLYGSIIKLFFTKLKFKKYFKPHHKNPFFIHIKDLNDNNNGLHINNLNNFRVINNKKVVLLPWYDKDNPIIMFLHNSEYNANKIQIHDDIAYFEKHIRYNTYNEPGKMKTRCIIDCWDTYYEVKVLKKYAKLYKQYDYRQVNETINYILLYPNCCNQPKYVPIVTEPQYIPYTYVKEVPKYIDKEPVIKEVIKYLPAKSGPGNEFLEILSDKIKAVNDVMSSNNDPIIEEIASEVVVTK
jgi:hypothetical protein